MTTRDVAAYYGSPARCTTSSLYHPRAIDVSDTERPDPPPTLPVRCSNRLRSHFGLLTCNPRPVVRRRVLSPPPAAAPLATASLHSIPARTSPIPLQSQVHSCPADNSPVVPPSHSVPPVFVPLRRLISPPVVPSSPTVPIPTSTSLPSVPASQSDLLPMLSALRDILHTIADNQTAYFQYAVVRDQNNHNLLQSVLQRLFHDAARPLPSPATLQPFPPSTSSDPSKPQ